MAGTVNLSNGLPVDLDSDAGKQFVVDACRAGEGLLSDAELQEAYELSPADWAAIEKNAALGRAIRAEGRRRVSNGTAAREAAARYFVRAPSILDGIMVNAPSPKHQIEAAKELRQVAAGDDADRPAAGTQFVIRIDLSAGGDPHVEEYSKTINIDVSDEDEPSKALATDAGEITTKAQRDPKEIALESLMKWRED